MTSAEAEPTGRAKDAQFRGDATQSAVPDIRALCLFGVEDFANLRDLVCPVFSKIDHLTEAAR